MIIINDKTIEGITYFPQNKYSENNGVYKVTLVDRGTNKTYSFENVNDEHIVAFDYYTFNIDFSKLPDGEYEYSIFDSNNDEVGSGIIRINDLVINNIYNNENRTYKAYDKQ